MISLALVTSQSMYTPKIEFCDFKTEFTFQKLSPRKRTIYRKSQMHRSDHFPIGKCGVYVCVHSLMLYLSVLCVCLYLVVSLSPSLLTAIEKFMRYYDVDASLLAPLRNLLLKPDLLMY